MSVEQRKEKSPISPEVIYQRMLVVVFAVTGVFLVKNIVGKNVPAMIVIGLCLVLFTVALLILKRVNLGNSIKYTFASMAVILLIFIISLFSGASNSDDFLLFLSAICLCGLFLKPKLTMVQIIAADVFLVLQAVIRPETIGTIGQFLLCLAAFNLAAILTYNVIKRGRCYISMSDDRTKEAESLVNTLTDIGTEIHNNFQKSTDTLGGLNIIHEQLMSTAQGLRTGSEGILSGTEDVVNVCDDMREKIVATGNQIGLLNKEVGQFEVSLSDNRRNIESMMTKMEYVQKSMQDTNEVFHKLELQMRQIVEVTEKLNKIAANTTMLALNASIEAARAGKMGEGFAVVASKVQDLAVDSNRCSAEVAEVVGIMQEQIKKTTHEMEDSKEAINSSLEAMAELSEGCNQLTDGFNSLYSNIAEQNNNVGAIDDKFVELKEKISDMSHYSQENQVAVESITEAITAYKENMQRVLDDNSHMSEVSEQLMNSVVAK